MKTLLKDTTIGNNYAQILGTEKYNMRWIADETSEIFQVYIRTAADFLAITKDKAKATALVLQNGKGDFVFGSIVTFHAGDNSDATDEMPGNWSLEFTLDEEDIDENTMNVIQSTDAGVIRILNNNALTHYGFRFNGDDLAWTLSFVAFECLRDYLDSNCKDNGELLEVEEEGFFTASVVLENAEKIMSIVPSGAIKKIIKDDAALS